MPPDARLVVDLYTVLFNSKDRKLGTLKSTCLCPQVSTSIITSFLLNISHISDDFSLFVDLVMSPWTLSNANLSAHAPSDLSYLTSLSHVIVALMFELWDKVQPLENIFARIIEFHKRNNLSLVMRKPAFCICENKYADQLRGNREADQGIFFRYTDSTIPLVHIYETSSL